MSDERPLVRNAADPKQVKAAGLKARYRRDSELNDLRVVLSTREGRRFYWRLLSQCGLMSISYQPNARYEETTFREGMRNIGLNLFTDLTDIDPDLYVQMAKENRGDNGGRKQRGTEPIDDDRAAEDSVDTDGDGVEAEDS